VKWYKLPAPPRELAEEAVYGLPELYADQLRDAPPRGESRLLSDQRNSGAAAAGGIRLDRAGARHCLRLQVPAATGAGKEPKREMQFREVDENLRAYGLFSHRHTRRK